MTNKLCNLLDNFQALENKEGMLGTIVGILFLLIASITSIAIGVGFIYMGINFFIDMINRIFF